MFDMFKNMGAMAGLMRNLPKLKEQMEQFQRKVSEIVVEGDAGAGMVKVKCNGRMEVLSVAVNQALTKAKAQVSEETSKMAAEMGLPPGMGMNLPGMG